ncbi:MAG: Gfo/Idh/MocA family oxidoreductase [Bacteroidia bacterium]|nr:Gfo/Idh/MocA family oxidoreductase [Bacteroidia bacterium]
MKSDTTHTHVLRLAHPPIPVVRIGIIGLGNRGLLTLQRYLLQDGVEIKALCEIREGNLAKGQQILTEAHRPQTKGYTGTDGWRLLCEQPDIDLILICTDWQTHTSIATYAMTCGKHVGIEVPAATSVEECWLLVDTAEQTRRHCIMLENCCYDPFALNTLQLSSEGVLGEIMHTEGAYIHDLRHVYFADENTGGYHNNWGKRHCMEHTGNPYPTHGLGPICQLLAIHRMDRMTHLVSMSTAQAGLTTYAERLYGTESAEAKEVYKLGDMNTTLIQTERGKSILLQYSTTLPRPYSRLQTISGTRGFAQKYPVPSLFIDEEHQEALTGEALESYLASHPHPFLKIAEEGKKRGATNLMNYTMDYRLIDCLRQGLPLDMDVYDAAEWSCITELSEHSILLGHVPVEIPDFTRGAWKGERSS